MGVSDWLASIDPLADLWQHGKPGCRYALLVLTGINLFNYVDRYVPSAVKTEIQTDLNLNDFQSSLPLSMFIVVYMAASPIFGHLSDHGWSRKKLIAFGVLLWSLATALGAIANSFGVFLFARMLVGVGEAAYASITPALMSDYFRPAQRNKALAFFYLAIPVGAAVGFTLGGALATAFGWRWAFAICGLPGVLLSLLCLIIDEPERGSSEHDLPVATETAAFDAESGEFVDGHTQSPSLGGEGMTSVEQVEVDTKTTAPEGVEPLEVESQVPQAADPGHPEPEPPMPWWPALVAMWNDKGFVYSLAGTTLVVFASGGMADWFTSYLQRVQGFSLNDASLYTGAMTVLGGIGGTVFGAWASDKLVATGAFAAAEFLLMSISIALSSAFAFAALYTPGSSRGLVVLFLFLTQFFLWFYSGPSNSVMSRVPLQVRTRAFAVSILIQHALGDAIASPIVGVISDSTGSLATAVGILPFFLAAGALIWFIGWVRVPDPMWTRLHNNSERHFHSCFGQNEHNE